MIGVKKNYGGGKRNHRENIVVLFPKALLHLKLYLFIQAFSDITRQCFFSHPLLFLHVSEISKVPSR
jgi:hypothetical protein